MGTAYNVTMPSQNFLFILYMRSIRLVITEKPKNIYDLDNYNNNNINNNLVYL